MGKRIRERRVGGEEGGGEEGWNGVMSIVNRTNELNLLY